MRIEVEELKPGCWTWHLRWRDVVIDAPASYGSEMAAHAAAEVFCRDVGRAPVRG